MKDLLDALAATITGCIAEVEATEVIKSGVAHYARLDLWLKSRDGVSRRRLLAVVVPPRRWPVQVIQYHLDEQVSTGYTHEWGRDPNVVHEDNPPTIDNRAELQAVLDGIMGLDETRLIIQRMGE